MIYYGHLRWELSSPDEIALVNLMSPHIFAEIALVYLMSPHIFADTKG